ncbi:Tudor domain-containing protein [Dirofilaria immitis]
MLSLEDLKIRIVSVIGSEKNGCTRNDLCRLYKDLYGNNLRPEDHGFKDLQSLLISPTMQGEGGIVCKNGRYFATGDENTIEMLNLVRNTKSRNPKPTRRFHAPMPAFGKGEYRSLPVASIRPSFIKAANKKLSNTAQIISDQIATQFQANSDKILKSAPQTNSKATFHTISRYPGSYAFENQQLELITPLQASNKYQFMSTQRNYNYDNHSAPSVSGIQRQSYLNKSESDGVMRSQKGRKRLLKLIEQHGGQMNFSEMKDAYRHSFGVSLNSTEICRLFSVKEEQVQDLYEFLKSFLCNYVVVTKQADDDLLLTVIDEEDDIDEFENFSFTDAPTQRSLLSRTNDKFEYWKGPTLASAIRSKDDCLPYKVLGDKILSFVQEKGSFKVSDLSKIFFEEDGRHIDPKNYREGTWENIIKKLLSAGGHPELVVFDGILGLRKDFRKFVLPSAYSSNNWTISAQNESGRSTSLTDNTVPAAIIYDLLIEAGRPLSKDELLKKLNAKGIKVNACQLIVKLITKFKDVFYFEFHLTETLISLVHGAKRPEESIASSCMPSFTESVKIVTHVMSDYCSTVESADNIFKPILLVNIVLIDEPLGRFRIQAFFRLRSFERAYNLFEKKMCLHYLYYGQEKIYAVEKPIKGCNYVFHNIKNNQVYRVRCVNDNIHAGVVLVYFIDHMQYQDVPVSQLKKLTDEYVKPAYGVVAETAPFTIVPGKENEFHKYFSQVCSKLLGDTKQDIQADVVSEPSKNLFELKQLYSEAHGNLNVPATFVRQNLIRMASFNSY